MASHLLRASIRAFTRPNVLRPIVSSVKPSLMPAMALRPFSVAPIRRLGGSVDSDLVHKLGEEIEYESSSQETARPAFIDEFLESTSFKLEDKRGQDEVTLTRHFGNERVQVLFSISDINNSDTESLYGEEETETDAEESIETSEEAIDVTFPSHATVTITKEKSDPSGKHGALAFEIVAQDGALSIESAMFYKNAQMALEQSAQADWDRRGLYIGPQFIELDEGLQELFEGYLEERGVNSALAQFMPDYIEYKEQQEYSQWLKDVKNFVSA